MLALVLGGSTGLLGQALVAQLKKRQNWDSVTLGRQDGDLLNSDFLKNKLKEIAPDVIFNTVAFTQVDLAEDKEEEAKRLNLDFPVLLASLIKDSLPAKSLVHYSTDFVFAGEKKTPLTEADRVDPQSVYGKTKYAGEQEVLSLLPNQALILRTAWLFGPYRRNFVTTILNAAAKNSEIKVVNDQMGSPTYTMDLASWSLELVEQKASGLWHAVNRGQATWYELAKKAVELKNMPCTVTPITSKDWPQKAKRPSYSVLNCDKLTSKLHEERRTWDEALQEFLLLQSN